MAQSGRRFEVTISPASHSGPVTGRLVLIISKQDKPEPRLAISPQGPAIFGIDLDQLKPNQPAIVTDSATGYPMQMANLPSGDYSIQAVVNLYEQLHRADGHTIWAHMNDGTIEFFNSAAGNLYSDIQHVHIGDGGTFRLAVTHVIPRETLHSDTEWIKHVRIQSPKLTQFWGRPVYAKPHDENTSAWNY